MKKQVFLLVVVVLLLCAGASRPVHAAVLEAACSGWAGNVFLTDVCGVGGYTIVDANVYVPIAIYSSYVGNGLSYSGELDMIYVCPFPTVVTVIPFENGASYEVYRASDTYSTIGEPLMFGVMQWDEHGVVGEPVVDLTPQELCRHYYTPYVR